MRHTYPYTDLLTVVANDVAEHQMTVLHDDGLYRHVRFRQPTNSWYMHFDLITWPGVLVFNGDMGSYMFSRVTDMFDFFTGSTINPGYWGEKLRAKSDYRNYSEEVLRDRVTEYVNDHVAHYDATEEEAAELRQLVQEEILDMAYDNTSAQQAMNQFHSHKLEFSDVWEWDLTDYTYQYLWACAAIRWGIEQYKASR